MIDNHRAGPAEQPGFQLLPLALLSLDFQVESRGGDFVHQSLPEPIFQRGHRAADQVEADPARTRLHEPVEFPRRPGSTTATPRRGPRRLAEGLEQVGVVRAEACSREAPTASPSSLCSPRPSHRKLDTPALPAAEATAPPVASAH